MKKIKILIVDDDEELCGEISEILRDEGYSVNTAHDGFKAFELIKARKHDIILLDLKLPSMSGSEILRKIKETNFTLKVIVLSGRPFNKEMLKESEDEELNSLRLANAILSKPYDIENLLEKIKELTAHG